METLSGGMLREARRREAKILIVDAQPEQSILLEGVLRADGYTRLRYSPNLYGATDVALEWRPDLVILDLSLPTRGGFEVLGRLRRAARDTLAVPLLALSGDIADSRCARVASLLGLSQLDFLSRPFDAAQVHGRVRALLEARWEQTEGHGRGDWLQAAVQARALELECSQAEFKQAQAEMIVRLALAAELHDSETVHHTQRVGLSASLLAQSIGLHEREVEMIQMAAPLHDIGKIAIPDALLLKPGKLSPEEWDEMKTHCRIGAQVLACGQADLEPIRIGKMFLSRAGFAPSSNRTLARLEEGDSPASASSSTSYSDRLLVQVAQRIALFHHERWDGSGYPMGLREEQIPLEARILAVADVFDALTHERPYKRAWPIDEALREIESQSARHFDPQIVAAFKELPHETLV